MKRSLSFLMLLTLSCAFGLAGCPSQEVKNAKPESASLDAGQASRGDAAAADVAPPPPRKTVAEILAEARNLKAAGNYKVAIEKYKEALQRKPSLYAAWYNVGVLEDYLSPGTGGAASYQKALQVKADYYPAINNLFRLYLRQKRRSQAASLIQNKAGAFPKNFQIRNLMIRYYIYAKRYSIAERMAREIQRKDERNAEAILNLGLVWYFQKKYELAKFALKNTLKICNDTLNKRKKSAPKGPPAAGKTTGPKVKKRKRNPEDFRLLIPEIHYYLSFVRLQLRGENKKNYQFVVSNHLEPALKIRPVYPEAMALLGEMRLRLGQFKSAETLLQKVIQLNPEFWPAQLGVGIAMTQQGRREDAAKQFIRILKKNPYYSVAHYQLGILYLDGPLKSNFGAIRASLYDRSIPPELKQVKRLKRTVKGLVRWGTASYHLSTYVSATSTLPADAPARGYLKTAQKQLKKMKKRLKQRIRSERRKYLKRLKKKAKKK